MNEEKVNELLEKAKSLIEDLDLEVISVEEKKQSPTSAIGQHDSWSKPQFDSAVGLEMLNLLN